MDRSQCRALIDTGYRSLCVREDSQWNTSGEGGFGGEGEVKGALVKTLVTEAAVVGFAQIDNLNADMACLARTSVFLALPDGVRKNGVARKYPRFIELPFVLHDGVVHLGTSEDGGFYKIIDEADDRRFQIVTRGSLKGAKAHPIGQSRKGNAPADKKYALYREPERGRDKVMLNGLAWMFQTASERAAADQLKTSTQLSASDFSFCVAPAANRPLQLRFENGPDDDRAKRWIDAKVAENTQNGHWGVPGFDGLTSDIDGEVVAVFENNVLVRNGEIEKTFSFDPVAFGEHIRCFTGVAGAPPVKPIVQANSRVNVGDTLFGPWEIQPASREDTAQLVTSLVGKGNTGQMFKTLRQIRAWSLLTNARQLHDGRFALPIEGVVPSDLGQVYLRLKTDKGEDIRVQRILLLQGAPGVLRIVPESEEVVGFRIDLYNQSQTTEMRRSITAARKVRQASGKAKPVA